MISFGYGKLLKYQSEVHDTVLVVQCVLKVCISGSCIFARHAIYVILTS